MKMNELSQLMPFCDANGRLTALPAKHKKKLMALWYLAGKLEAGQQYTQQEINDLLDEWTLFHDAATLRRELFNKRLLHRTAPAIGGRRISRPLRRLWRSISDQKDHTAKR